MPTNHFWTKIVIFHDIYADAIPERCSGSHVIVRRWKLKRPFSSCVDQLDSTEFRINDQSDNFWDFGGLVFVTERWRLVTFERTFGNERFLMKVSQQWQSEDGVVIYSSDWIAWLV